MSLLLARIHYEFLFCVVLPPSQYTVSYTSYAVSDPLNMFVRKYACLAKVASNCERHSISFKLEQFVQPNRHTERERERLRFSTVRIVVVVVFVSLSLVCFLNVCAICLFVGLTLLPFPIHSSPCLGNGELALSRMSPYLYFFFMYKY